MVEKNTKQNEKIEEKQNEKIKELRIELLKPTAKRRKIKKEIARELTLQNNKMKGETKK